MASVLRLRNDTSARWASVNPVLQKGEAGWDATARVLKIGDGATRWADLPAANADALGIGLADLRDNGDGTITPVLTDATELDPITIPWQGVGQRVEVVPTSRTITEADAGKTLLLQADMTTEAGINPSAEVHLANDGATARSVVLPGGILSVRSGERYVVRWKDASNVSVHALGVEVELS